MWGCKVVELCGVEVTMCGGVVVWGVKVWCVEVWRCGGVVSVNVEFRQCSMGVCGVG